MMQKLVQYRCVKVVGEGLSLGRMLAITCLDRNRKGRTSLTGLVVHQDSTLRMTPQQVEKEELGRIETIEEVVADDKDCGCASSIGIGIGAPTTRIPSQDLIKDASNAIGTKKVACTARNAAASAAALILWSLSLSSSCSRAGFRRARHSQLDA